MYNNYCDNLQRIIEEAFDLDYLFKDERKKTYIVARSVFNYIITKENKLSITQIANKYGYNHSTIINSIDRFEGYFKYYKEYKDKMDYVISEWASIKDEIKFTPEKKENKFDKLNYILTVNDVFYLYEQNKLTGKSIQRFINSIKHRDDGVFVVEYKCPYSYDGVIELYPNGIKEIDYRL